jgi:phage-related protein
MEIFKLFGSIALNDNVTKTLDGIEPKVLKADTAITKMGENFQKVGAGMQKAGGALTKFVTLPILGAGAASFKFASDFSESLNKVDVAFKSNAGQVEEWSKTTLKNFGIAQGSALDMAALFGDMGTSMGLNTDEASKMSMSLVGLAGDLSSFKNIGLSEATTALNGIFTGETESLKTLGIVMTQANLQQFAYSKGINKTIQQMTQAEQTQLRYQYVMSVTANSQGDFANTSEGAANQMRIFKESLKELASSFGQYLLPIITPIITKVNEFVQWIGSLDEGTKKVIITIAAIVAVIGPLLLIFGTLISTIGSVVIAFQAIAAVAGTTVGAVAGIAAIIPIVIAAVIGLAIAIVANWDFIKETFSNFINWLGSVFTTDWSQKFGVLGGILNDWLSIVKGIFDNIKLVFSGLIDFVKGVFTGNWSQAWNGVVSIFRGIFGTIASFAKAPLNGVIALINGAIRGLNKLSVTIPDWVPEFGGRSFGVNLPQIPMLANGGNVTNGDAIVGEAGAELLSVKNGRATVTPLTDSQRNSTSNRPQIIQVVLPDGRVLAEVVAENQDTIDRFNSRDVGGAFAW